MEMGFEHDLWRQPVAARASAACEGGAGVGFRTLDWHELSARLAAAHAFQRVARRVGTSFVGGSFHPAAARRIFVFGQAIEDVCEDGISSNDHTLRFVNLVDSAVRKHAGAKDMCIAGSHLSGDRGLI